MESGIHEEITREVYLQLTDLGIRETRAEAIVSGNGSCDSGDNENLSAVHFDNCAFREGVDRIRDLWRDIAEQPDRFSKQSLERLGAILHAVQDFYAHSNWVEYWAVRGSIPVWDLDAASLPREIVSGTCDGESPKRCSAGVLSHKLMNKDSRDCRQGRLRPRDDWPTYFEIARDAAVRASAEVIREFKVSGTSYRVTTVTGNRGSAGTDADVFIILHTLDGWNTGRVYLDNEDLDDFERGNSDTFIVGTTRRIDEVAKITIGFALEGNLGDKPGWFLESVTVERLDGAFRRVFPCSRWLAADEGDGRTIVEIS